MSSAVKTENPPKIVSLQPTHEKQSGLLETINRVSRLALTILKVFFLDCLALVTGTPLSFERWASLLQEKNDKPSSASNTTPSQSSEVVEEIQAPLGVKEIWLQAYQQYVRSGSPKNDQSGTSFADLPPAIQEQYYTLHKESESLETRVSAAKTLIQAGFLSDSEVLEYIDSSVKSPFDNIGCIHETRPMGTPAENGQTTSFSGNMHANRAFQDLLLSSPPASGSSTPEEFYDLWLGTNAVVFVNLAKESEGTYTDYVPKNENEAFTFGKYTVTLSSKKITTVGPFTFEERSLSIKIGDEEPRVLTQLYTPSWPDQTGSPDLQELLFQMVQRALEIRSAVKPQDLTKPENKPHIIGVHCKAGVGRSAVFAALCELALNLEEDLSEIVSNQQQAVFDIVKQLRFSRDGAVQTEEQYQLIGFVLAKFLGPIATESFKAIRAIEQAKDPNALESALEKLSAAVATLESISKKELSPFDQIFLKQLYQKILNLTFAGSSFSGKAQEAAISLLSNTTIFSSKTLFSKEESIENVENSERVEMNCVESLNSSFKTLKELAQKAALSYEEFLTAQKSLQTIQSIKYDEISLEKAQGFCNQETPELEKEGIAVDFGDGARARLADSLKVTSFDARKKVYIRKSSLDLSTKTVQCLVLMFRDDSEEEPIRNVFFDVHMVNEKPLYRANGQTVFFSSLKELVDSAIDGRRVDNPEKG